MTIMEMLDYNIKQAVRQQMEAKAAYIRACELLARSITDAGQKAKDDVYVSETVMSSSLVQEIPQRAIEYRDASRHAVQLQFMKSEIFPSTSKAATT